MVDDGVVAVVHRYVMSFEERIQQRLLRSQEPSAAPTEVRSEAPEMTEETTGIGAVPSAEIQRSPDPDDPVLPSPVAVVQAEEAARILLREPGRLWASVLHAKLDAAADDERAMLIRDRGERCEPVTCGHGVVVEERDEVPPRTRDACVAGR